MISASIPGATTLRSRISMYVFFIKNVLIACFVNSSPEIRFRIAQVHFKSLALGILKVHYPEILALKTCCERKLFIEHFYIDYVCSMCAHMWKAELRLALKISGQRLHMPTQAYPALKVVITRHWTN
jgi:hypothetical protein